MDRFIIRINFWCFISFRFLVVPQTGKVNICVWYLFHLNQTNWVNLLYVRTSAVFCPLLRAAARCVCWWHFYVRHFIFINEIISACTNMHRPQTHTASGLIWIIIVSVWHEWNGRKSAFVDYTMLCRLPFQIGLNYSFINKLRARSMFSSSDHLLRWCFWIFFSSVHEMQEKMGAHWCGAVRPTFFLFCSCLSKVGCKSAYYWFLINFRTNSN